MRKNDGTLGTCGEISWKMWNKMVNTMEQEDSLWKPRGKYTMETWDCWNFTMEIPWKELMGI
jgi:hypothetical protein